MKNSQPRKRFPPDTSLEQMLQSKSFEQLLADQDVFDVQGASHRSGYTPQHIRRLCHEDRLPHIRRGVNAEVVQYYFLPEQLRALFVYHAARA